MCSYRSTPTVKEMMGKTPGVSVSNIVRHAARRVKDQDLDKRNRLCFFMNRITRGIFSSLTLKSFSTDAVGDKHHKAVTKYSVLEA